MIGQTLINTFHLRLSKVTESGFRALSSDEGEMARAAGQVAKALKKAS
jgi:hypothetical protein